MIDDDKKLLHERLRDFDGCGDFVCENGETIGLWGNEADILAAEIERCYIPISVDENGELWEIGDACIAYGSETHVCGYGKYGGVFVFDEDKSAYNVIHPHRLKRLDSEPLDSEGVRIKVGDTVWCTKGSQLPIKVARIGLDPINGKDMGVFDEDGIWCRCGIVTHREPDTQEKIDADKVKDHDDYWRCGNLLTCDKCPSLINGVRPRNYYGVNDCMVAMGIDIARRQYELYARKREN